MGNDLDLRINGTVKKTIASGSGENVLREINYSGTIETLEFRITGGGDFDTIKIRGVAVDGNLLVNHSSIGVDMSGNKNNLYDQSFGFGNSSQVWDRGANSNWQLATSNMFNGSLEDGTYSNGSEASMNWTAISAQNSIEFYIKASSSGQWFATFTGDGEVGMTNLPTTDYEWVDASEFGISYPSGISGIKNRSQVGECRAIQVDGKILVNPQLVDQVLDTPMKNYAVLETGVNGNLTGSGTSTSVTYKGEPGVTYYFEEIKEDGTMVERRRTMDDFLQPISLHSISVSNHLLVLALKVSSCCSKSGVSGLVIY